jgi:predicted transcriptional regulator
MYMVKYTAKNFRSSKKGLGKVLGHLEQEIMEVLWTKGEASGKGVLEEIRQSRDIAFTTVLTVLERLVKKGLVKRTKGLGGYIFCPVFTKEEFTKAVSKEVLQGVMELWRGPAVASFVDILAKSDPHELDRLSRLIEEKKMELETRVNDSRSK